MKTDIHPKYMDAEIRCACGNVIKTRSTKNTIIIGICNSCHPFYTGQQKFVDTAGPRGQVPTARRQDPGRAGSLRHEEEKESLAARFHSARRCLVTRGRISFCNESAAAH